MKAIVKKVIKNQSGSGEPIVVLDIIDKTSGETITKSLNVNIPIKGLDASPNKELFVKRLINDILKDYKSKRDVLKAKPDISDLTYIKEGEVIEHKEDEPDAFDFLRPIPGNYRVQKARSILTQVDINEINTINDLKLVLLNLLVVLGLKKDEV